MKKKPIRHTRTVWGVLKLQMRACFSHSIRFKGLTFAEAWGVMTWDNFCWVLDKLPEKDRDYLQGYRNALDRVSIITADGSRRLSDDEKLTALRVNYTYPRGIRCPYRDLRDLLRTK